jgi:hypothetical protein
MKPLQSVNFRPAGGLSIVDSGRKIAALFYFLYALTYGYPKLYSTNLEAFRLYNLCF